MTMAQRAGILWALICGLAGVSAPAATVYQIDVDGAIGPATPAYIQRGIDAAKSAGAECLIIRLDTPGGLLDSTKTIVQSMLNSPVPTVVYVAPRGATAGSAGTFITLAADVAAMAPATTIGAAHPVSLGYGGSDQKEDPKVKEKHVSYAVRMIEAIAAERQRNVEWAKSAVSESATLTADKALEMKVIEIVAADRADLLGQLDGRQVRGRRLHTGGASVVSVPLSLRERVFQALWRPEVMFVLMLITVYGIIGELSNPGAIFPGVAGAVALILLLYMTSVLPMNVAGLALIGLAIALFIIDVFAPTHGVLTIGGIAAFFIGSLMLFDTYDQVYRLSLAVIIPATVATAAFFLFIVGKGLKAQLWPTKMGRETMVGRMVPAVTAIDRQGGRVLLEGEFWNAVSDQPVPAGQAVRIDAVQGLTLTVTPAGDGQSVTKPPL